MTIKDKLIQILSTFGYPVFLQGSLNSEQRYPPSFFTFWNNETYDGNHYDNAEISYIWNFDVNFYSNNPELVNTVLISAKAKLKQEGFIVGGVGYDLPTDEITHTGRGINVIYQDYSQERNEYNGETDSD